MTLLTPDQAADRHGKTRRWVIRAAREGRIPAIKIGRYYRFDRGKVEAWQPPPPRPRWDAARHRTYATWHAMKRRCLDPAAAGYQHYGGRGTTVCEQWRDSFGAFLEDMGERPEGASIDRIDSNGNYEPGNCRWATREEQRANQRQRRKADKDECSIGGCTAPVHGRGWCQKHYRRWKRHGDPVPGTERGTDRGSFSGYEARNQHVSRHKPTPQTG